MKLKHLKHLSFVAVAALVALGCGRPVDLIASPEAPHGDEKVAVLIYLDTSRSMDSSKVKSGDKEVSRRDFAATMAVTLLRDLPKPPGTGIVGSLSMFGRDVMPIADFRLVGSTSGFEKAISEEYLRPGYSGSRVPTEEEMKQIDELKKRSDGTSLIKLVEHAEKKIEGKSYDRICIAIFTDGAVEDYQGGSIEKAFDEARKLARFPNLTVLVVGTTDYADGDYRRLHEERWKAAGIEASVAGVQDAPSKIQAVVKKLTDNLP